MRNAKNPLARLIPGLTWIRESSLVIRLYGTDYAVECAGLISLGASGKPVRSRGGDMWWLLECGEIVDDYPTEGEAAKEAERRFAASLAPTPEIEP